MRFVFYTHSLVSDWNHGNAHFLRGVMRDLMERGHEAVALEPEDAWSRQNLIADQGTGPIARFQRDFPDLTTVQYADDFDHEKALDGADVVVVHEWTDPGLVARLGALRRDGGRFALLFHDTHHRAVSEEAAISRLDLENYDLVLAFGETLRQRYLERGWGSQVVTWHEAADARLFHPIPGADRHGDLVWVGNWGDDERTAELETYLVEPAAALGLNARIFGVRYPESALARLRQAGIAYEGWLPNADVPRVFSRHAMTVHVPRRPYVTALPGIPTIRVFEALASGIPLISAPWQDSENLFRIGTDFLMARNGTEMRTMMRDVLEDRELSRALVRNGLETIRSRHTCAHRVYQLLDALAEQGPQPVRVALGQREAAQ